jgi:hypothetical protein
MEVPLSVCRECNKLFDTKTGIPSEKFKNFRIENSDSKEMCRPCRLTMDEWEASS